MSSRSKCTATIDALSALDCWRNSIEIMALDGGMTNMNFLVQDGQAKFVARVAKDLPHHNIFRWHEAAASIAAQQAGIGPRVHHWDGKTLILEFIEGRTFSAEDVRTDQNIERISVLLKKCHNELRCHWRGGVLSIWPFQVVRGYANILAGKSCRHASDWPRLLADCERLETAIGPVELSITHNDLLAENFIDDGDRLWLIDWEYSGANCPFFDIANLSVNNAFSNTQEYYLLQHYLGKLPSKSLLRKIAAYRAVSALREAAWSMVQECYAEKDFNYARYTETALDRFVNSLAHFDSIATN